MCSGDTEVFTEKVFEGSYFGHTRRHTITNCCDANGTTIERLMQQSQLWRGFFAFRQVDSQE
jgi:hypothetical protein